ncbi:MAG: hypothetical protein IKK67_08605 [Bacteroidaceae bacterium]|nr:hypothetical protein [Bacteroidaceae bacterium]
MKKITALVLALIMTLSLLPTIAWAETDSSAPSVFDRLAAAGYAAPTATDLTIEFPTGLVEGEDYTYTYEDGMLTIHVLKGSKANWEAAYNNIQMGNNIVMNVTMPAPPDGATGVSRLNGNLTSEQVQNYIENRLSYEPMAYYVRYSIPLAAANAGENGVVIAPTVSPNGMYIVANYCNSQYIPIAKWMLRYQVVVDEAFVHEVEKKEFAPVPANRITVMQAADASPLDTSQWNVTIVDGSVTVQAKVDSPALGTNGQVGYLRVATPDGYSLVQNTYDMYGLYYIGGNTAKFVWKNNTDGSFLYEQLTYAVGRHHPYMLNIGGVPTDYTLTKPSSSITVFYEETMGRFHTSFTSDVIPTVEELLSGMKMKVPDGAKTYRRVNYVANQDACFRTPQNVISLLQASPLNSVDNSEGYTIPIANVRKVELESESMTVYFSNTRNYTERIVEWYSDEAGTQSLGITYLYGNNDDFAWSTDSQSVEEVTEPVEKPTIESTVSMTLTGIRYPQLGNENKLYIELKASELITDGYVVYIPYSYCNGMTWEIASQLKKTGKSPMIHHYTDNHGSYSVIKGEYTEFGIRFETPSFSPFVISWDDADEGGTTTPIYPIYWGGTTTTTEDKPIESPKTFDTGVTLYVGMSIAAAVGTVTLSKKRED